MPGVKRGHQSFTFEYKLKVIAHADNFESSQTSFVFGCGLSASNLLRGYSPGNYGTLLNCSVQVQ